MQTHRRPQCDTHGMVAYRLGHIASRCVNVLPFALTAGVRAAMKCRRQACMIGPCLRCEARPRNEKCGLLLCRACCTEVRVDGRGLRCGVRKHDREKGSGLAPADILRVPLSTLYAEL